MAGFALRRTADENLAGSTPDAVQAVKSNIYVDDLLKSVPNSQSAVALAHDVISLLEGGGFELTKFSSNCSAVLKSLPPDRLAPHLKEFNFFNDTLPGHKTLGLVWHPQTDTFAVKVKAFSGPLSRRGLLSLVMSVFDPLGMVAPFMLPLKSLIQRLIKAGLTWDAEIMGQERIFCVKFVKALTSLNNVTIPRCFASCNDFRSVHLHAFADASVAGMGAVCFLRMYMIIVTLCRSLWENRALPPSR